MILFNQWFEYKAYCARRKRKNQELYVAGFDYALGALVRREKKPLELDAEQTDSDRNLFDVGINSAIDYAVQHGLVKDDRM